MNITVYKAKRGWEFKITSKNGRYLAGSRQGYKNKGDCKRIVESIMYNYHWNYKEIKPGWSE